MSKTVSRTVIRKVEDLVVNCYVRRELNQEHAIHLGELIEEGVRLPPILITKGNVVVDGRHRIQGYELNGIKTVKCQIVQVSDEIELISCSYRANTDGSLLPRKADTEHTVAMLLEKSVPMKDIGELLGLPPGLARRYCQGVKSRANRAKMQRARDDVAEGMSVPKAAEKHGVNPDKLREHVSGRRRRKTPTSDITAGLTATFRSLSQRNAAICRRVMTQFEDGDISEAQATVIFDKLERLLKQSTRSVTDWRNRFKVVIDTTTK